MPILTSLQGASQYLSEPRRPIQTIRVSSALIGSGDRSERIRTYNFPQGRITDHRINLTIYRLEAVLAGELDALIDPLIREHQAELLAQSAGLS